jgi:hypothetical protein
MIGDSDCGEIGGMKIGRGNRSTRRKPAPTPLGPPQIPHAFKECYYNSVLKLSVFFQYKKAKSMQKQLNLFFICV